MTKRLALDPDVEHDGQTRELRDEELAETTLQFDDAGRTQELDDDVAAAYLDSEYPLVDVDDIGEPAFDEVRDLLSGTVDEIAERVDRGEFDDRLQDVRDFERAGEERTTVFDAVERRERVVEGDEEGEQ